MVALTGGPCARHYRVGCRRHLGAPDAAGGRTREARRARPAHQIRERLLAGSTQGDLPSVMSSLGFEKQGSGGSARASAFAPPLVRVRYSKGLSLRNREIETETLILVSISQR